MTGHWSCLGQLLYPLSPLICFFLFRMQKYGLYSRFWPVGHLAPLCMIKDSETPVWLELMLNIIILRKYKVYKHFKLGRWRIVYSNFDISKFINHYLGAVLIENVNIKTNNNNEIAKQLVNLGHNLSNINPVFLNIYAVWIIVKSFSLLNLKINLSQPTKKSLVGGRHAAYRVLSNNVFDMVIQLMPTMCLSKQCKSSRPITQYQSLHN